MRYMPSSPPGIARRRGQSHTAKANALIIICENATATCQDSNLTCYSLLFSFMLEAYLNVGPAPSCPDESGSNI